MAEESGSLSSLGKLIPSVYYDLIARICPGVGFLLALLWHKIHIFDGLVSNAWIAFFILLGAGYIAGLVLTALSSVYFFSVGWLLRRCLHVPLDDWHGNDKISKENPEVGMTLAKMGAEETLAQNLLIGFIILWIVNGRRALCLRSSYAPSPSMDRRRNSTGNCHPSDMRLSVTT